MHYVRSIHKNFHNFYKSFAIFKNFYNSQSFLEKGDPNPGSRTRGIRSRGVWTRPCVACMANSTLWGTNKVLFFSFDAWGAEFVILHANYGFLGKNSRYRYSVGVGEDSPVLYSGPSVSRRHQASFSRKPSTILLFGPGSPGWIRERHCCDPYSW